MLTEVSLTLHFSGFGAVVIVFGPPGRDWSRCLSLAKRAKAGSSVLLSSREDFGGDLLPRGAL